MHPQIVYLKSEVEEQGVVKNDDHDLFLVAQDGSVNGFKASVQDQVVSLAIGSNGTLVDQISSTIWDIRGKYKSGSLEADLERIILSDEFWYSWKLFHPRSELIRL